MKYKSYKTNNSRLVIFIFLLSIVFIGNAFAQPTLPSTSLPFNDRPDKLQFAVISDLWGGYRPGVFEDAVKKIELLQPQFVMSVGDLISGATFDSLILEKEWNEFNANVNRLTMPFFYVPGNHDIGNSWMEKEWKRRFTTTYYSFVHNNALFLCLNTQDGGSTGINAEQISYFKDVIAKNSDVRWTFVFMHIPVWQWEDGKMGGYAAIESALKGRNYTLFSGHHHTYSKTIKEGNNHYALGTTGGGSDMRGIEYGEFDHITLVTLSGEEPPRVINLLLDGMLMDDVHVGY